MKWFKFVLLGVIYFSTFTFGQAPDSLLAQKEHQQLEASFEKIVSKFATFFQKKQKLIHKEAHPKSESGYTAYIIEYTCTEVNYGVSSSSDPKTPYQAFILLSVQKRDNRSCGKLPGVTMFGRPAGWGNISLALASNKSTCFKQNRDAFKSKVKLVFDYQDKQWVLTDVQHQTKKTPELPIGSVFGLLKKPAIEISDATAIKFNQKWQALLEIPLATQ